MYPAWVWDDWRVRRKDVFDTNDFFAPGCMCRWDACGRCPDCPFDTACERRGSSSIKILESL